MFKELRQRIGQGLTASSGGSLVTHGQVGRADFVLSFLTRKMRENNVDRLIRVHDGRW